MPPLMSDQSREQTTNAPQFDPLNCSAADEADMMAGYLDAWGHKPPSRDSIAYAWGHGSAARDRGDEPDEQRREVERRHGEKIRNGR